MPEYEKGFEGYADRSIDSKGRCTFPKKGLFWEGKPYEGPLTPVLITGMTRKAVSAVYLFQPEILVSRKSGQGIKVLGTRKLDDQRRIALPRRKKLKRFIPPPGQVAISGMGPYCVVAPFNSEPPEIPPEILVRLVHPVVIEKLNAAGEHILQPSAHTVVEQMAQGITEALKNAGLARVDIDLHVGNTHVTGALCITTESGQLILRNPKIRN